MDTLGSIAGLPIKQNNLEIANKGHAESFIRASEEFYELNKDLDPETFYHNWNKEVGDSWDIQPDNKEYYYKTLENIDPQGPQAAKDKVLNKITADIATLNTAQEREWKMKDIAHTLPDYAWTELDFFKQLDKEKSRIDGQFEETVRIGQYLTYKHALLEKDFTGLDPDKTSSAHAEDYLKGIRENHGDDINVDNGNFSISLNGQFVPLSSIPDNTSGDIRQLLIENRDIKPLIEKKIKKEHAVAQRKAIKEREETQEYIFKSVSEIPREFRMNAVKDYAMRFPNGAEITDQAIRRLVEKEKNVSPLDTIRSFNSYYSDLLSRTKRMLNDG